MKLKSVLITASVLAFVTANTAVLASDDHHDDGAHAGKTEAAMTEKHEAKKPVKKHSHMEEKTGVPAPSVDVKKDESMKTDEKQQMMKHDHMKEKH